MGSSPLEKIGYVAVIEGYGMFTSQMKGMAGDFGKVSAEQDKATKTSERAKTATEKLNAGLSTMRSTVSTVAAGLLAFTGVFQKAFEFGREGAAVLQMRESFDRLMTSIGASPDILDKLRKASNGTVSDLDLMSSTMTLLAGVSDEMALELANAAPGILNIAKAAAKLNPALGDTTFFYNSLMTGIKRGQPLIIDNTGLQLKMAEALDKFAAQTGRSSEELSANEKTLALLNATMEAGDQLIKQVGGTTDAATDSFDQMKVVTGQLGTTLKTILAPGITSAASAAVTLLTMNKSIKDAFKDQVPVIADNARNYRRYVEIMQETAKNAGYVTKVTEDGIEVFERQGTALVRVEEDLGILTEKQYEMKDSAEALTERQQAYVDLLSSSADTMNPYLDALQETRNATQDVDYASQDLYSANQALVGSIMDGTNEFINLNTVLDQTMSKEDLLAKQTAEAKVAYSELQTFMAGKLGEEIQSFTGKQEDLRAKMGEVNAKMQVFKDKGQDLTAAEREELAQLQSEYDNLKAQYDENAAAHKLATSSILFDLTAQALAVSGIPYAEQVEILGEIAAQWGLIDDDTKTAYNAIGEYIGQLQAGKITAEELAALINKLNMDVTVDVHWDVDPAPNLPIPGTQVLPVPGTQPFIPAPGTQEEERIPTAKGANFIVPPGYYQDNFPLNVQSGEHVIVIPREQVNRQQVYNNQRSNNFNINVHTNASAQSIYQSYPSAKFAIQ